MIILIRTIFASLLLGIMTLSAQDFQGVATYKTKRNINIKMDTTKVSSDIQKKMMEQMKKQFEKTFLLSFNKTESLYTQEAALDKPQIGGGGFDMVVISTQGSSDILYKNNKAKSYTNQTDTMGKIFLVKDELEEIDWKLEPDTKYIGEYLCFKATYTKEVEVANFKIDSDSNASDESESKKPEMETRIVTAWYTTQIPVNSGPSMYHGLPGLILEVHDGELHMVCSKIVLNPEEAIKIEEPTKGKVVSQKEHDAIVERKTKEMLEKYAPRPGRSGETFEIRIGG